ncbi:hypothetical protein [Mycolicibacterium sphagni]|uniref:hypothetical protein n=1 Tax=Mycolicibacterium sphagni TaxID=1786 RepID=UPI0021F33790|nr:hypothetical protein [Mycolicibacterium sphagni]MCV7174820.1 hypothetical protein [Mycolicibacterium sphagni]
MGHWDENPHYPVADWRRDVVNDNTRLGYHDWVAGQAERDDDGPTAVAAEVAATELHNATFNGYETILLTQTSTVVRRLRYSRQRAIAVLILAGDDPEALRHLTDRELGERITLVAKADTDGDNPNGLYDTLYRDAGDPEEEIDSDDWELTEVYGEQRTQVTL